MTRYPHYWWPLKGARFPSRIAYLDCDGAPDSVSPGASVQAEQLTGWCLVTAELRAGVPIGSARFAGRSSGTLWQRLRSLLSSKDRTWLYCGPTGRILPLIGFWRALEEREITLVGRDWRAAPAGGEEHGSEGGGVCVLEEPPTVILCQLPDRPGKLLLLDIRNYGIEIPLPGDSAEARCEYAMRGLRDMLHTLRSHGRVSLRCTAGSQAVSSLRSNVDCVALHCHTNAVALKLERAAYFGGRCECYRLGDIPGPVYHLDVRNMYPSLCLDLPIPVSLRRVHDDPESAQEAGTNRPCRCCAHVGVSSPLPAYPMRRRGDIIFPVGDFDTYLCGRELEQAVAASHITRWHSAAEYTVLPQLRDYYSRWLALLADARSCGNMFMATYVKRVMNALVGKFGEPGRQWIEAPPAAEMGPYASFYGTGPDGAPCRYRNVGWFTQMEEVSGESYWSCPAIAAWITSAGRARLWHLIESAGRQNVWYTDTDSIICGQDGYDRLLDRGLVGHGEVGALRLIGRHSRCTIYGIRHYVLDDTVTCAGVPRGDIRPGETRGEYWWRRQGKAEIAMGSAPTGREQLIHAPQPEEYHHGRVGPDGYITPWEVS